jgi:hypothetical protein
MTIDAIPEAGALHRHAATTCGYADVVANALLAPNAFRGRV